MCNVLKNDRHARLNYGQISLTTLACLLGVSSVVPRVFLDIPVQISNV